MDHNYRITYNIDTHSFELESTDKAWIDEKEKAYLTKIAALPPVPAKGLPIGPSATPTAPIGNLTINEFYKKLVKANKIKSRVEMAVFFVYYVEKILKKDGIRTADIGQCFADISYPGYNKINITDLLAKAKLKGYLNYVSSLWSLTFTGEDFVVNAITNIEG